MADVTFTVDGKKLTAPAGTLLIEACRAHGIEIPAFCYYPGLSLQAACRMCVVRIEKMPKLQTACTTPVAEGMIVTTESPEIAQARKATIELLLGNHPLDCPVCDAGGECELQDMTFKYGAHESKFVEIKQHRDEQQWSPVVLLRSPALHPLLPLRPRLRRRHGRLGAGRAESRRRLRHRAQPARIISTAKSAACASTSAPSARSPPVPIATRRAPGKCPTSAPSAPTAAMAARPPWACAAPTTAWRSCAATTATRAASTATSYVSRAVTHSTSPIAKTA